MFRSKLMLVALVALTGVSAVNAQQLPWEVFEDSESASRCGLVNAENAELVVLVETGQLVLVTNDDIVLENTFLNQSNDVIVDGEPTGFLTFAEDADGFRTLWWVSLTGRVITVDGLTGRPRESDAVPADFQDVPCDACEFWDEDIDACNIPTEIVTQPTGGTFCEGVRIVLTVTAVGSNIDRYQWFKNGEAIGGEVSRTLVIDDAELFDTASYSVDVIDEDGSRVSSDPFTVAVQRCSDPDPTPSLNLCGTQVGMIGMLLFASLSCMKFVQRRN